MLEGGAGNDTLVGGVGSDTYKFGRGDGVDLVDSTTSDATPGKLDQIQYASDIASSQLWFQREGNNLALGVIGTADKVNVLNWYTSANNQVQQIVAGDGKVLAAAQVQQLVDAMAGFAPPPMGQITLAPSYQDVLAPTLASSWK